VSPRSCRLAGSLLTLILLALLASPRLLAQANSTPEERAHWVELARKLEADPLNGGLNKDAEKAMKRLIEIKDIHIPLCGSVFTNLNTDKSKYSGQLTRQYLIASAVFVIQNPDKASDTGLMNLSAVQSVLRVYTAILQKKSDARSSSLDSLQEELDAGTLEATVRKKCGG
jgi:hypothetical protein